MAEYGTPFKMKGWPKWLKGKKKTKNLTGDRKWNITRKSTGTSKRKSRFVAGLTFWDKKD